MQYLLYVCPYNDKNCFGTFSNVREKKKDFITINNLNVYVGYRIYVTVFYCANGLGL